MILHIETKDQKIIRVALKDKGRVVEGLSAENEYGSQVLLPLIMKLLQKVRTKDTENPQVSIQVHPKGVHWGVHWEILDGIEVEAGPGSFTGIRVGVAIANALGFSLGVPVNGKKIETELNY